MGELMEVSTLIDEKTEISSILSTIIPDYEMWDLKSNFVSKGINGVSYSFEYALISRKDEEKVPVILLRGNKNDRLDQIAALHLKSKAINASRKIAISSTFCTPYENFLAGMFNVTLVRENSLESVQFGESETRTRNIVKSVRRANPTPGLGSGSNRKREYNANRKRRDRTKIVHDILELADSNVSFGITKIIYRCNLNYNSAQTIINDLIDRRLLEILNTNGAKKKFRITETGLSFLSDLKKLSFSDS